MPMTVKMTTSYVKTFFNALNRQNILWPYRFLSISDVPPRLTYSGRPSRTLLFYYFFFCSLANCRYYISHKTEPTAKTEWKANWANCVPFFSNWSIFIFIGTKNLPFFAIFQLKHKLVSFCPRIGHCYRLCKCFILCFCAPAAAVCTTDWPWHDIRNVQRQKVKTGWWKAKGKKE